jgi:hypothetical protein
LPFSYPSVDFIPVKIETVAKLENRKVAAAEQSVNRAVRDLQIPRQFVNRHKRTRRSMVARLHGAPAIRVREKAKEHLSTESEKGYWLNQVRARRPVFLACLNSKAEYLNLKMRVSYFRNESALQAGMRDELKGCSLLVLRNTPIRATSKNIHPSGLSEAFSPHRSQ